MNNLNVAKIQLN